MPHRDIVLKMPTPNDIPRNGVATSVKTRTFPPPPTITPTDSPPTSSSSSSAQPTQLPPSPYLSQDLDSFEDDIDADPQSHFLSPMASYEYWDDSDDEDSEPVEWDAGIVDFGLFYDDHKQADVPLPNKWDELLADQARAYQESVERTSTNSAEPEFLARTTSGDSLPSLTPDSSPLVKNDMDYESESTSNPHRTSNADNSNFKLIVTPPQQELDAALAEAAETTDSEIADSETDDDEEYLPLEFFVRRSHTQRSKPQHPSPFSQPPLPYTPPPLARPGLRFDRTMSGKRHSWVRPSRGIWSIREGVGEDTVAEDGNDGVRERATLRRGRSW